MYVCNFFVIAKIQEELDPLGIITLETVGSKNQEIEMQVTLYSANKSLIIHPLSMLLNGIINAAVQGGVKNYDLIFMPRTQEHPEDEDRVKNLRRLIEEQVCVCVYIVCVCVCMCVCICVCTCVYVCVCVCACLNLKASLL